MFKVYINNRRDYKVVSRGAIGTIDLLNILKTLQCGLRENARKINAGDSGSDKCSIQISDAKETEVKTGDIKAEHIAECINEIMKKYARELVGEVEELTGILKGKDLERYLDLMIQQNNAKGNTQN